MARRKIKIKRIEDATTRQVTFSKRRGGLLKKAHDLSVLCDAEVAVIVFSGKGKLFQFASPSMHSVLERYEKCRGNLESPDNNNSDITDTGSFTLHTEKLKILLRNLYGDDLDRLCLKDLAHLEQQLHESLGCIRAKKGELFLEQLEEMKEKARDAGKTSYASSNLLAKLVDSCPSEVTGSHNSNGNGDCLILNVEEALRTDALLQLRVDSSDQNNQNPAGLPVAKRSKLSEDLNRSPECIE